MDKDLTKKLRIVALQVIAEYYLKINGKRSSQEEFPNSKDVFGELNNEQAILLRGYLGQEYQKQGLDLKTEVEKAGERMINEKLSNYELEQLAKKADEFILMSAILEERKAKLNNEVA